MGEWIHRIVSAGLKEALGSGEGGFSDTVMAECVERSLDKAKANIKEFWGATGRVRKARILISSTGWSPAAVGIFSIGYWRLWQANVNSLHRRALAGTGRGLLLNPRRFVELIGLDEDRIGQR